MNQRHKQEILKLEFIYISSAVQTKISSFSGVPSLTP